MHKSAKDIPFGVHLSLLWSPIHGLGASLPICPLASMPIILKHLELTPDCAELIILQNNCFSFAGDVSVGQYPDVIDILAFLFVSSNDIILC